MLCAVYRSGIECVNHPGRQATPCPHCKQSYCDACLSREIDKTRACDLCANARSEDTIDTIDTRPFQWLVYAFVTGMLAATFFVAQSLIGYSGFSFGVIAFALAFAASMVLAGLAMVRRLKAGQNHNSRF